ncbi:MAG: sigma 54-interacting transcriptional regulator [Clostridiaceae bacterium]
MKSIGIVTNRNSKVSSFLKKNLECIFKGFVKINDYFINEFTDDFIIEDDVVLFMVKEKALECEKYVLNKENIIMIERTVRNEDLCKLFTLHKNTRVLVVNDIWETTLEMVALLYQIEINELELIPYKAGEKYENINIAITPDEEEHVPKYIDTIINIGNRCIDISTFIKIINKLGIENRVIDARLIEYSEEMLSLNEGIKNSYKSLFIKNEKLNTIINLSKDGVLFIDNDETIVFCNSAFRKIFRLENRKVEGRKLDAVLKQEIIKVFRKPAVVNQLLEIDDICININKQEVVSLGQNMGVCFNIQELTYIKQLEQNLGEKLLNNGLITKYNFENIKTNSAKMKECIYLGEKISKSNLTVLIIGESGTGKELLAQSIHNFSDRNKQPFVAVNCAALPESLLESELFGYEGGAFTGALREGKRGLFEQANNGTIFLDEIGDMPISLQARMLRVLQERQVMRIGSSSVININVRVIAATNRNLIRMIDEGTFREDLFYRLNVLHINIPPLRERREDIILILKSFIKKDIKLSQEVTDFLLKYNWPGNIRELQNVASYIELMCDKEVSIENIPHYIINSRSNFDEEFNIIKGKLDVSAVIEVMEVIRQKKYSNVRVGRKNIEETLRSYGIIKSEGEIRSILTVLNNLGFIVSNKGRRGSELTAMGLSFLKWVKNRSQMQPV